jgi:hypothetical protein
MNIGQTFKITYYAKKHGKHIGQTRRKKKASGQKNV